ncbi:MAG: helix-turn-helix domain-containing protein [Candidatus Sericytochromatia bacterium]|nr:helix-turn-helix domain-containing protein [Candidatus Sericytochromatia bacterium]MEB3221411.1 helix-turn-helix domain-containing protein [Candidatus Sericytochromatia bacterium]
MASLSEVGQRLKQAREAQGLSLAEVSSRTRITVRHLKAIEEGLEADLPEVFYVRGFLKKYAEVVGLSPTDVADFYRPAPVPTAPLPDLRQGSGPLGYYAAIGAFLLLLLGLAWYFQPRVSVVEAPQPSLSPAEPGQAEASAVAAVSPDVAATPALEAVVATRSVAVEAAASAALPASGAPPAEPVATAATAVSSAPPSVAPTEAPSPAATAKPDTISLTLALKERSWIEVRVGGRLVKEGIANRGEMHRFKGNEIEVSAGNAGGVHVFRNGREAGRLGAHGEVVTRVFKP